MATLIDSNYAKNCKTLATLWEEPQFSFMQWYYQCTVCIGRGMNCFQDVCGVLSRSAANADHDVRYVCQPLKGQFLLFSCHKKTTLGRPCV